MRPEELGNSDCVTSGILPLSSVLLRLHCQLKTNPDLDKERLIKKTISEICKYLKIKQQKVFLSQGGVSRAWQKLSRGS